MKIAIKIMTASAIVILLSACGTVPPQSKYSITTPSDNLLRTNHAPPPPMMAEDYSVMTCERKEQVLIHYSFSLLDVIGRDHADKEGLRIWKRDLDMSALGKEGIK